MDKYLFHGTQERFAYSIMCQGFHLNNEMWGRGWGDGIYLSGTQEFASMWGKIIITCELNKGTRILWHSEYDRRTIFYLRREFGARITRPDFWKDLPTNKQLKKSEIIALWNFLIDKYYEGKRRFGKGRIVFFQQNYSRIYEQLKLHQFDGVGFRDCEWPEILIFNPSSVNPISAHYRDGRDALPLDKLKTIQELAEEEYRKDFEEYENEIKKWNQNA